MLVLFIQSTRKSALLSAAKKAKLKNNPSRVRFAEGVVINGTTLPLVCFLRTAMFTYLMTVEAFLDFKNKSFRFYFSFRFCWLNAAIFIRETMSFFFQLWDSILLVIHFIGFPMKSFWLDCQSLLWFSNPCYFPIIYIGRNVDTISYALL